MVHEKSSHRYDRKCKESSLHFPAFMAESTQTDHGLVVQTETPNEDPTPRALLFVVRSCDVALRMAPMCENQTATSRQRRRPPPLSIPQVWLRPPKKEEINRNSQAENSCIRRD